MELVGPTNLPVVTFTPFTETYCASGTRRMMQEPFATMNPGGRVDHNTGSYPQLDILKDRVNEENELRASLGKLTSGIRTTSSDSPLEKFSVADQAVLSREVKALRKLNAELQHEVKELRSSHESFRAEV